MDPVTQAALDLSGLIVKTNVQEMDHSLGTRTASVTEPQKRAALIASALLSKKCSEKLADASKTRFAKVVSVETAEHLVELLGETLPHLVGNLHPANKTVVNDPAKFNDWSMVQEIAHSTANALESVENLLESVYLVKDGEKYVITQNQEWKQWVDSILASAKKLGMHSLVREKAPKSLKEDLARLEETVSRVFKLVRRNDMPVKFTEDPGSLELAKKVAAAAHQTTEQAVRELVKKGKTDDEIAEELLDRGGYDADDIGATLVKERKKHHG